MKQETKNKLFWAWAYCDEEDKSTGFMIQFMQDHAGVGFDTVMNFIERTTNKQRSQWYRENPNWYKSLNN